MPAVKKDHFKDLDRDRLMNGWDDSIDAELVNRLIKTFMKFEIMSKHFVHYVKGTYFEKRWLEYAEFRRTI